jgi:Predicted sugar isomerase
MDAFNTDVRPALADWRESRDLPREPFDAYRSSGELEQIAKDRVGGQQMGWGA